MANDENKSQLIELLLSQWKTSKYASKLQGRQLFFVCGEKCICLSSNNDEVQAVEEKKLFSNQEEADSRIILHCKDIASNFPTSTIVVRSPDTDVFILLLKFVQQIGNDIL